MSVCLGGNLSGRREFCTLMNLMIILHGMVCGWVGVQWGGGWEAGVPLVECKWSAVAPGSTVER